MFRLRDRGRDILAGHTAAWMRGVQRRASARGRLNWPRALKVVCFACPFLSRMTPPRPGTWAQGVARASGPEPDVAGHRQSGVPRFAQSAWVMRAPKWRLKETRGNRGEWLRSIRPTRETTSLSASVDPTNVASVERHLPPREYSPRLILGVPTSNSVSERLRMIETLAGSAPATRTRHRFGRT